MKKKPSIKIFCSHRIDKNCETINNPLYVNVRCGAIFDKRPPEEYGYMIGDDTGDNISEKRNSFNETTVLYWAWKNQTADYMGLCHYRRIFSCNKTSNKWGHGEHSEGCLVCNYLNEETYKYFKLDENNLRKEIEGYDAVFVKPIDLKPLNIKSNYQAMEQAPLYHNMKDIGLAIKIAKEKYPEMSKIIDKYLFNYRYEYLYNCFVMKKEIFNNFCSWLFDILFEVEKHIDTTDYSKTQRRALGLIGEHFFGIYVLWLKFQKRYRINELPLLFIRHPEIQKPLQPAFQENNIAIASNFNNNYASIFGVFLQSAKEHFSDNNNYDFIVFTKDISDRNKKLLANIIKDKQNASLRFINPEKFLDSVNLKIHDQCYSDDLYYRIIIPQILSNYDKVLVVDADTVAAEDLADLYNEDIQEYLAAAAIDTVYQGLIKSEGKPRREYVKKILELSNLYNYINTGVLLFNCKKYRETYSLSYLKEFIEENMECIQLYEQDMLNKLLNGKIKFINHKWNYFVQMNDWVKNNMKNATDWDYKAHKAAKDTGGIIHFANVPKPWQDPSIDYAELWWGYARKTPFYEEAIRKMCDNTYNSKASYILGTIHDIKRYKSNVLKYWKYKFLRNFVNGRTKSRYLNKKYLYKDKIRNAKQYMK